MYHEPCLRITTYRSFPDHCTDTLHRILNTQHTPAVNHLTPVTSHPPVTRVTDEHTPEARVELVCVFCPSWAAVQEASGRPERQRKNWRMMMGLQHTHTRVTGLVCLCIPHMCCVCFSPELTLRTERGRGTGRVCVCVPLEVLNKGVAPQTPRDLLSTSSAVTISSELVRIFGYTHTHTHIIIR